MKNRKRATKATPANISRSRSKHTRAWRKRDRFFQMLLQPLLRRSMPIELVSSIIQVQPMVPIGRIFHMNMNRMHE